MTSIDLETEKNLPTFGGHHLKETIYDVLASVIGSAACVYSGQPFDTVKVRLQVNPGEFSGFLDCLRKTARGEGITALWGGSTPAFMGAISENVMAFATNGLLKRVFHTGEENKSVFEPFFCGGVTGLFSATVLCPCDVVKCRTQVNGARGVSVGAASLAHKIWHTNGFRGLYRGFSSQLMRDVPFYASFFGSYEIICQALKEHTDLTETSVYFVAGGLSGQIGWVASIAPDTVKSRIQTADVPMSIAQTTREIVTSKGVRGLFVGVDAAVIRAFPANAALFVAYELSREAFSGML